VSEQIGPYQLRAEIARNQALVLWSAVQGETREAVTLLEVLLSPAMPALRREKYAAEFRWQGLAAAGLVHPGIVRLQRAEIVDGRPLQVLEPIPGETLRRILNGGQGDSEPAFPTGSALPAGQDLPSQPAAGYPLPTARALALVMSLLEALAFGHERELVHGNLSPELVFVGADGKAAVAGFGLPYLGSVPPLSRAAFAGATGYLAPEQITEEHVDARADIFAVGVLLYEMLTGKHPFGLAEGLAPDVVAYRTVYRDPPPVLDGRMWQVLEKALAKNPADRYQDAAAFVAALRDQVASSPGPGSAGDGVHQEVVPPRVTPEAAEASGLSRRKSLFWVLAGVMVLIAVGIALGVVFLSGPWAKTNPPPSSSTVTTVARASSTTTSAGSGGVSSSTSAPMPSSTTTPVLEVGGVGELATVMFADLTVTYNGLPQQVAVLTDPPGVRVSVTYRQNGSVVEAPIDAGVYEVEAVVEDARYQGSAVAVFTIQKADPIITVSGWTGVYDGLLHGATGSARGVRGEDLTSRLDLGQRFVAVPGGRAFWSYRGGTNYNSASGSVAIVILPRPITVRAEDKSKFEGEADPPLTYRIVSGSLAVGDRFSGSLTRDAGESPGRYVIRQGTLRLGANYALSFQTGALTTEPPTTTEPTTTTEGSSPTTESPGP